MGRRKNDGGWFEIFFQLFTKSSAWLSIPIAVFAFFLITGVVAAFAETSSSGKLFAQFGPLFAGTVAALVLLAGLKAGLEKGTRRKIFKKQNGIESIRDLSWSQFELLVGEAYRRQGYQVTETGGGGADGGIDLKLRDHIGDIILVQCKQWKVFKVGVKSIREIYGVLIAERASRAVFVTSGVFTQEAKNFANGKPIELIDGDALCRLILPVRDHVVGAEVDPPPLERDDSPSCPICQQSMILRTAKRGVNAGSQFWGCSGYPKCRGTRSLAIANT